MNHRTWDANIVNMTPIGELRNEHNALYEDWKNASLEVERMGTVNSDLCDKIAALWDDRDNAVKNAMDRLPDAPWNDKTATEAVWLLSLAVTDKQSIRLPFSDAQIEKMADAARLAQSGGCEWGKLYITCRENWCRSIRAALAAGGLEPCAVPDYAPEDVAFSTERASDEELGRIGYEASPSMSVADTPITWMGGLFESHRKQHCIRAAAVRARVEAPLLAEIAELRGEVSRIRGIADTFCVERNNVMKERDCIKSELTASQARVAELESMGVPNDHCITCGGITDEGDALVWQHERCAENVRLRAELEAVKAERDGQLSAAIKMSGELQNTQMCRDEALKALEQLAALRQRDAVPVKVRSGVTENDALIFWTENDCEDSMHTFIDYILENAVIAAPAGVPSVQELIPAVGTALSIPHDEKFSPYSERGWEYTRAVRARVEAPLLAEIERLKSEPTGDVAGLRAKIENQRMTLRQLHKARERDAVERMKLESEFVSVTAERDKAIRESGNRTGEVLQLRAEVEAVKAERDGLKARNDIQAGQLRHIDGEISPLMSEVAALESELAAVKAERDALIAKAVQG